MSDHEDETITGENAPPKNIPHITTVTNIFANFPYLKNEEYDIWAMKIQNFIPSSDLLCWNIILNGNNAKSMTTDKDGNLKIHPPVTAEEHQQVQREEKARTTLLFALPDEHIGDFYHMIDARDIWNAIKARFGGNAESKKMQKSILKQKFEEFKISEKEGLDKGYDKMQKILSQMNTLKIKPKPEGVNIKFLSGLPPSWSSIALILKTKGGLEYISFDDMYNKLKFYEIDTKRYSSSSSTLSNAAFVSTAGSSQGKPSYQESGNDGYGGYTTTLSASPSSSSSKGSSKSKCSVINDVVYSFFINHEIDQQLIYEDLDQIHKKEFEEYDLKHQMAMLSIKLKSDADSEGEVVSADDVILAVISVSVGPVVAAAADSPHSEIEFSFMGLSTEVYIPVTCPLCFDSKYKLIEKDYHEQREQLNDCVVDLKAHKHAVKSLENQIKCHQTNQLAYEEKIKVLSYELKEKSNILEYKQKLIDQTAQEKHELMSKLENEIANHAKWNNSGRNLYKLIDSSMSVRTKRGLGLDKYIGEGELGIDDSKFSIFHTNSDELEGQPIYNSDRSSTPSTNDFQTCDSSQECSRPNHSDHDSNDSISSVSAPANCNFHEQTFTKRNAEGKGILKSRPTGKLVNPNRPKPVFTGRPKPVSAGRPNPISAGRPNPISAVQPNAVSAGQPNTVFAGDGILGSGPLNIQYKSTYFHSFTHNNQQIFFPITYNSLYSLYLAGGLNGKTVVTPSAGWPWTNYGMSKTKGSKINGVSKSKSWSFDKGLLGRPKSEMTWVPKKD
nr:ribonuclease H-like domain-containing protein [Tanacetum cinerariifolium]